MGGHQQWVNDILGVETRGMKQEKAILAFQWALGMVVQTSVVPMPQAQGDEQRDAGRNKSGGI